MQSPAWAAPSILTNVLDRDTIARARRRRELEEVLADEVERERVLREQAEAVVLEAEAPRIDAALRAALDPKDLELIDDLLAANGAHDEDEAWMEAWEISLESAEADAQTAGADDELARLHAEIARSVARREALARAIALLETPLPAPTAEQGA